ncbi:MAG: cytochrome c maturation protein CcmE [Actinomycetota bacterium]
MTRKQRRLYFVLLGMASLGLATGLVLYAMRGTMVYFCTPADLEAKTEGCDIKSGRRMRIGGLVQLGSVVKDGKTVTFSVADKVTTVPAAYTGILPDLFREGQGVVAEGRFEADGVFHATEVLAKHDEKYMPKEVADALKKQGEWQGHTEPGTSK